MTLDGVKIEGSSVIEVDKEIEINVLNSRFKEALIIKG
jgi:hypothetical protein